MKVNEYGSEFFIDDELDKLKNESNLVNDTEKYIFVKSGRDALRVVAKSIRNDVNTILMPVFCCDSMVQPFIREGFEIRFYKMTKELYPDTEDLKSKIEKKSALLFIDLFGRRMFEEQQLKCIKEDHPNMIFIEDRTHNILEKGEYHGVNIDYTVASLRKWYALPDGGVVWGDIKKFLEIDTSKNSNEFSCIREKAMKLKCLYLHSGKIEIKNEFRKMLSNAEMLLNTTDSIETMSVISRKIVFNTNHEIYKEKRKCNFEVLYGKLKNNNKVKLFLATSKHSTLYFPIVLENSKALQKELAKQNIYCPVIWPIPDLAKGICENSEYISNNMLAIPCDHRYSVQDIEFIADSINEILNSI